MVLLGAWCLHSALRRNWRSAVSGAACAIPALVWWTYVYRHTAPDYTSWLATYPFSGILERTIRGIDAPVSTLWLRAAAVFEELALAGIWLALACSFYLAWKRRYGLPEVSAIAFLVFAAALGKLDLWDSAYATGRTMSPLLIVLGLLALRDRRLSFAIPMLLIVPRIALQYEAQLKGAFRGLI